MNLEVPSPRVAWRARPIPGVSKVGLRSALVALLLLLILPACGASASSPKRVLILNPYGRDIAPFGAAISEFRTTLARDLGESLDLYEVPLDLARFGEKEDEESLVTFLQGRLGDHPVDLVVPIGGAGAQFAARHRERLFPDTPVLVVGGDPRLVSSTVLGTNATLVTQEANLTGMVEDILRMQPQTSRIAVVFGVSEIERYWVNECHREFQAFTNRVEFIWLNDLPLDEVVNRCAALPPHSFILHVLFVMDANGVACERNEALLRLHEAGHAPLFGYFASEFGKGPIGGRLYQDLEIGNQGARIAIRILGGERPGDIPPQLIESGAPVYDWRELRRWGVSEARLPDGSVMAFREPGLWEEYRWVISGLIGFFLLQAALIVGLWVNWSKRRQGETEASLIAEISSKFVNLPASQIDREIQDAERRICALLGLDLAGLWQWSDDAGGTFILTHLYRAGDGPRPPEPMTARDHFPWYEQQMLAGRTIAVRTMDELPPEAARDRAVYEHFGIKSVVAVPLSVGGQSPVGILGFNTTRAERDWPEPLVKRLHLVAQIFANALARKRADQALRESEEKVTLATDSAEVGLWELDGDTRVFWATDKARSLFGYTADEIITMRRFETSVHPEDLGRVRRAIETSLTNREPLGIEYRLAAEQGASRWIASRGRPYFKPDGQPERLIGTSVDITERKRVEAALRDLSRRLIRAHEQERARLGRELHDDITQRLARLAIDVGRMERGAAGATPVETMQSVREGLVRLSEDVHALSYRLHPAILEDLGLAEAVKAECERFSRQQSVPAEVRLENLPADIPPEPALCLFRVMQEALRNVSRHARAHRVEVSLRSQDQGLQLAVMDDGAGFDPAAARNRPSLGLASMRERVSLVGGELDIESAPGQGTTVVVWVPTNKAEG